MNVETLKSSEERALIKYLKEVNETVNKIFGTTCKVELNISGAPVSKVALMKECNNKSDGGDHRAYVPVTDTAYATVTDTKYLPF